MHGDSKMNQRTRSSSRRTAKISRAADAQALRAARGMAVPAAVIDTLCDHGIDDTLPAARLTTPGAGWTQEHRHEYIAEAAYLRAQSRGFVPGHELEDWLAAEKAVDALLATSAHSDHGVGGSGGRPVQKQQRS